MSDHREIVELIPWYVNGTLGDDERAVLERHFKSCLPCHSALREAQRVQRLMRTQPDLPLNPAHGIGDLLARIDGGRTAGARVRFKLPLVGYGIAAALGGVLVWLVVAVSPEPGEEAAPFTTLSAPAEALPGRIDVVFAEPPDEAGLREFVAGFGGELVAGPSDLGRYTFALPEAEGSDLDAVLAALRDDPRVVFAGPSFIDAAETEDAR